MTTTTKTFGELNKGTVINYSNSIYAENNNYVILEHTEDKFYKYTKTLNMKTLEIEKFIQHTEIKLGWSIVKNN